MKNINDWTREDFEALPSRKWDERIEFNCLVVLPGRSDELHESGYRYMDFVAVVDGVPKCRLSGCSDIIHFDGIGGYGEHWLQRHGDVPEFVKPSGWQMDCLRKSGLLNIFSNTRKMACGPALSSFEIYSLPKETNR